MQRTDIHNSARSMCDRSEWAKQLWLKMQALFVSSSHGHATGLNEQFRFYRYGIGEYFKPHLDGADYRSPRERFGWTVLIYVNEDIEGGETKLFRHKVQIAPKAGSLLAFVHRQLHAENEVNSGTKYVLRSDVMDFLNA